MPRPTTLPEKVWDRHVVRVGARRSPTCCTSTSTSSTRSPARRRSTACASAAARVRRPELTVATEDHNVPTEHIDQPIADPVSARQVEVLRANTAEFGITNYPMGDPGQGIVHVIGPEQGRTLPGHDDRVRRQPHRDPRRVRRARLRHRHQRGRARARHPDAAPDPPEVDGGRRSTASCPPASRPRTSSSRSSARSAPAAASATSSSTAARPSAALSMEGRMTVCNMSIEAGAKAGLDRPRRHDVRLPRGPRPTRRRARHGTQARRRLAHAAQRRRRGVGQGGASSTRRRSTRTSRGAPTPARSTTIDGAVPSPDDFADPTARDDGRPGPRVHGPRPPGTPIRDIAVDTVFIGSCTNSRIEDLRAAAGVLDGRHVTAKRVMVVPGSHAVKAQAEAEGLRRHLPRRRLRLARARAARCAWR